jgi:hypothetical protein
VIMHPQGIQEPCAHPVEAKMISRQVDRCVALSRAAVVYAGPVGSP